MAKEDPVREFLEEKGCGPHLVEAGLPGLVGSWEHLVQSVDAGYRLGLDDYLNDLDVRQLIEEALDVASSQQRDEVQDRISRADEAMRSLVVPVDGCLWGAEIAEEEEWTAKRNWWYFSRPVNANPELQAEIDGGLQ